MRHIQSHNYASEEARLLAEKVYSQAAAQTLDVRLNIHLDLNKRDPNMLRSIISCMLHKRPFILYQDFKNYTIFTPVNRGAVCFKDGNKYTEDVSKSNKDYENRLKMAMMGYENFFEPANAISNGETTTLLQLQ